MAITQIRSAQVLDATITKDDLNTDVAGVGISGGAGTALALDLNELSAAVVDVANDLVAIEDATDNSTKKESIADIITAVAGIGLVASAGVLAVDLDGVSDVAVAVAADSFAFLDSSDSGDTKKDTIADLMTAVAGAGLTATSGVLAVSVDSGEIVSGAVDVDHLSDLRVTEGTGLVADVAAGTVSTDNGTTVTVLPISSTTTTVTDDDESFVEVDISGSVTNNITGFTQGRLPLARVTAASGDITAVVDSRAWLDIDLGTTGLVNSNFVDNEVPVGDLDGADTTYTLDNTPSPTSSLRVYLNGIRQDEGASDDYTLTTNVITFAAAPISTDKVLADYRK